MPILSKNPVTVDGKTYDRIAVSLAISPVFFSDDLGPSVAVRLEYYCKNEDGTVEKLPGHSVALNHTALAPSDVRLEQMVKDMLVQIQGIVDERGL
jgi:hypothetical protein